MLVFAMEGCSYCEIVREEDTIWNPKRQIEIVVEVKTRL